MPKNDKRSSGKKSSCVLCAAAQASSTNQLDSLATLGRRTQPAPFASIARSAFDGATVNFVSTATGALSFAVTDLELPGTLPIMFQRIYASDSREDFGLGAGWSFAFDDRITIDGDTATMRTGNASTLAFRRDGASNHFVLQIAAPALHQSFDLSDDGSAVSEQISNLTRTYAKLNNIYRLAQIADANGNTINISFDANGRITRINNSSGSTLALQWSNEKNARLLAVTDHANRRITFDQDAKRLRSVTDATGAKWSYDYRNDQLTRASDPMNRTILRARYDAQGRAIETGDAIGSYKYEYANSSSGISPRTIVTDPLGAQTTYEHTAQGAVSAVSDDEGNSARIEYNAENRPQRMSDSAGGETRFTYDAANRLQSQTSSDGTSTSYAYDASGRLVSKIENGARTDYTFDARGNIIAAKSDDPKQSYGAGYDSHGQLTAIQSDAGDKMAFEHDAAGNETAFTVAKRGRFEIERDSLGRAVTRRLPSGATYRYEYNARGKVTKQSDNQGRVVTFERDASGAATGAVFDDGKTWIRAVRDEAGRITEIKTSAGKSRKFAYDTRGALTDYTNAQGKHKHMDYDHRGRLQRITDDSGNAAIFKRDKQGRVQQVAVYDRSGTIYQYDLTGHLLSTTPANFFRIERASYRAPAKPVLAQDLWDDCFFGGDSWFPDDTFYADFGMDCWDPFGGFGDGDFDPFYGFLGETCDQCMIRQKQICDAQNEACALRALANTVGAATGCTVIFSRNRIIPLWWRGITC